MKKCLAGLAVIAGLAAASVAQAALVVVDFSYVGSNTAAVPTGDPAFAVTGLGSLSFPEGLMTVGLGDLTDFTFNHVGFTGASPSDFRYGLPDLIAFSLSLGAGPSVTGLSLQTGFVANSAPSILFPQRFSIAGTTFGSTDATTIALTTGPVSIDNVRIESAVVPLPASLPALLAGVGALWVFRRRKTVGSIA